MKDDYVLYADDEQEDQFFLQASFNALVTDVELECVTGGEQVIDFLEDQKGKRGLPCLIILDQNMPAITGNDVIKMLKSIPRYKDIPIIIFSTSKYPAEIANHYKIIVEEKPRDMNGWRTVVKKLLPAEWL